MQTEDFKSFKEFYPFYLSQHSNLTCRKLHFFGTWLAIYFLGYGLSSKNYLALILCPVSGYFFAWIGHFVFEKNRPATFQYPFYSFAGDCRMFWDICRLKLKVF